MCYPDTPEVNQPRSGKVIQKKKYLENFSVLIYRSSKLSMKKGSKVAGVALSFPFVFSLTYHADVAPFLCTTKSKVFSVAHNLVVFCNAAKSKKIQMTCGHSQKFIFQQSLSCVRGHPHMMYDFFKSFGLTNLPTPGLILC